jgi:cytochrome c556
MINIRYALAGALLLAGSATLASAQQTATPPQARHGMRAAGGRGMMGPGRLGGQLFKGITLSDAEKANIKNVQAKFAAQNKALREQFKPQMQAARDARQRGDTAALNKIWQQSAGQREQTKQLLLAERSELRSALTSTNQAAFDANVAALEKRMAKHATNDAKHPGRRPPTNAGR